MGGGELCEDGNERAGDGCSTVCTIEEGFQCGSQPSVCTTLCGDGTVHTNERRDETNLVSGDGCSATCLVERGYTCSGQPAGA